MSAMLRATAGLIGWAAAFSLLYGLQGLACSPRAIEWLPALAEARRTILIAAWLLSLVALAWLAWRFWPPSASRTTMDWIAAVSALVGLVATAYTGLPVATTTACL